MKSDERAQPSPPRPLNTHSLPARAIQPAPVQSPPVTGPGAAPLDRRVIEIEQAALFVAAAAERWGGEAAWELLRAVVREAAEEAALAARRKVPDPTLADLWEVWRRLGGDGRLDLELLESTPRVLRFRVRRCAYAEAYRAMNLMELGLEFSCRRDEPFARAFLPGVRLALSATIMEGGDGCVFEYVL